MSIADKLATIAENEQKVYEAGEGAIWDMIQQNGARTNYQDAFRGWSTVTEIVPKYPIKTTTIYEMFHTCNNIVNLPPVEIISTPITTYGAFAHCNKLKSVDFDISVGSANASVVFADCYELETIQKIITTTSVTMYTNTFRYNYALKNITFEGEINGDIGFQWSTLLSRDSITSIINALSSSASGLTCTFSKTAVDNAFETSTGAADGSASTEWAALVATKTNWTISLM